LEIYKLTEKLKINEANWLQRLERISVFRFLKFILDYQTKGKRNWEDVGRDGNRPNGLQADNDGVNMYKN
jgi:hypothetical protein